MPRCPGDRTFPDGAVSPVPTASRRIRRTRPTATTTHHSSGSWRPRRIVVIGSENRNGQPPRQFDLLPATATSGSGPWVDRRRERPNPGCTEIRHTTDDEYMVSPIRRAVRRFSVHRIDLSERRRTGSANGRPARAGTVHTGLLPRGVRRSRQTAWRSCWRGTGAPETPARPQTGTPVSRLGTAPVDVSSTPRERARSAPAGARAERPTTGSWGWH